MIRNIYKYSSKSEVIIRDGTKYSILKYWLKKYLKALINDAVDLHAKKFRKVEYCSLPQVRSLDNTQKSTCMGLHRLIPFACIAPREIVQHLIASLSYISQLFSQPQTAPGTLKGNIINLVKETGFAIMQYIFILSTKK